MESELHPLVKSLARRLEARGGIPNSLYVERGVKQSLREPGGEGVPAVLTRVGDAFGSELRNGKKEPAPGKLFYRGYSIEDLAADAESLGCLGFEQAAFLLLFGELPGESELNAFAALVGESRALPKGFAESIILAAPSPDLMNMLARCALSSYIYDPSAEDASLPVGVDQSIKLIARLPVMAAYSYQARRRYHEGKGMALHTPRPNLSTAENFLRLIRQDAAHERGEAEMLDLALLLHAEGGANNASFIARAVSSTGSDIYSAIGAAIAAFKGPRHGGANIRVAQMIDDIKANVSDWSSEGEVGDYLRKILRKEAFDGSGLVYGMGHVFYTLSDPRAEILRGKAARLAGLLGREEEYGLYRLIERIFPAIFGEETGSKKPICANLDFYTACVYSMLGIPRELFAPLFACARAASWCAHRLEELMSGARIWAPAFIGIEPPREHVPIERRQGWPMDSG